MKSCKKINTMLLIAVVLLIAVFMTGCTKLSEKPNSAPSGTDALAESDGFGVYVKLERDDVSSIALHGGSSFTLSDVDSTADGTWRVEFEKSLLENYDVTPDHYEDLGNGVYQVYVEIDGKIVPYVAVDSATGDYHG